MRGDSSQKVQTKTSISFNKDEDHVSIVKTTAGESDSMTPISPIKLNSTFGVDSPVKTMGDSPFKFQNPNMFTNLKLDFSNATCKQNTKVSEFMNINRVNDQVLKTSKKAPFQAYLKKSSIQFSYLGSVKEAVAGHKRGRSTELSVNPSFMNIERGESQASIGSHKD